MKKITKQHTALMLLLSCNAIYTCVKRAPVNGPGVVNMGASGDYATTDGTLIIPSAQPGIENEQLPRWKYLIYQTDSVFSLFVDT